MKTSGSEYFYNHKNGLVSRINFINKTCNCNLHTFKSICLHSVYVALEEKADLPGIVLIKKLSIKKRKKIV